MTSSAQGKPFKQTHFGGGHLLVFGFAVFANFYFNFADFVEFILVISNVRLTSASTGFCDMSRISWLSQKHANFVRFYYFSCIPFVSLSFLPLVYKTSIYKLSSINQSIKTLFIEGDT